MAAANWYPDPAHPSRLRWWDGTAWTEHTAAIPVQQPVAAVPSNYVPPAGYAQPVAYGQHTAFAQSAAYGQQAAYAQPTAYGQPAGYAQPVGPAYPVPSGQYGDPVVRRESGRVFLPLMAVVSGVAPDRCCRHGQRAAASRKVTFQSRLPWWSYLTIFAGLLVFVVVAVVIRKSAKSPAWPFCRTCLEERRRNLTLMWVTIALVVPGIFVVGWLGGLVSNDQGWLMAVLMVAVVAGLPITAVVFGMRGSFERLSGGTVTQDGQLVSVPEAAFPDASSRAVATAIGL